LFGSFIAPLKNEEKQVALLRSQDTLELYRVTADSSQLQFVTKYCLQNAKATEIAVVKCPFKQE